MLYITLENFEKKKSDIHIYSCYTPPSFCINLHHATCLLMSFLVLDLVLDADNLHALFKLVLSVRLFKQQTAS